jgi:hypothetical protein
MRQPLALLALCAVLRGVGAGPADATGSVNYGSDGTTPCFNTVNGVSTSATDVDGNIIKGCNNVVSNVTSDGIHQVNVLIYGSDNVVSDDIVHDADENSAYNVSIGWESSDVVSNGNEVTGNVADYYIGVWNTNKSVLSGNTAVSSSDRGYLNLDHDLNLTVTGNVAVAVISTYHVLVCGQNRQRRSLAAARSRGPSATWMVTRRHSARLCQRRKARLRHCVALHTILQSTRLHSAPADSAMNFSA